MDRVIDNLADDLIALGWKKVKSESDDSTAIRLKHTADKRNYAARLYISTTQIDDKTGYKVVFGIYRGICDNKTLVAGAGSENESVSHLKKLVYGMLIGKLGRGRYEPKTA